MNRTETSDKSSDSIRSEIDETRHKMDSTIDALSERLKGRHLIDEVVGFFRSSNGSGQELTSKITEATNATMHRVVESVKAHPLPVLVMGAGLAWLIYERQKNSSMSAAGYEGLDSEPLTYPSDPDIADYSPGDLASDAPADLFSATDYPSTGSSDTAGSAAGGPSIADRASDAKHSIQAKAADAKDRIQQKTSELAGRARQGFQAVKQRTSTATAQVKDRTREVAGRTKQQISRVAEEHPLEVGFTCLAVGLLAGLLSPTSGRVQERIAPTAQKVRERARDTGHDLMERGKRVVTAAADAARTEAETQGLTPGTFRAHESASAHTAQGEDMGEDRMETSHPAGSPPPPVSLSGMSGDEQRVASDIVQPKPPPQPFPQI